MVDTRRRNGEPEAEPTPVAATTGSLHQTLLPLSVISELSSLTPLMRELSKHQREGIKAVDKLRSDVGSLQGSIDHLADTVTTAHLRESERCKARFTNGSDEVLWVYSYNRSSASSSSSSSGAKLSPSSNEPYTKQRLEPGQTEEMAALDGQTRVCDTFRIWVKNDKNVLVRNTLWQENLRNDGDYTLRKEDWKRVGAVRRR
ncbi:unnamed protein product [Amoebophrya sp. A25]|nr:unnamed protein product [Amoebophrya sp. A25]|eukprot:GSA25T00001609001.1